MLLKLFTTSAGTKLLLGLSGLALVGFLVGHLAGNLTFLAGPDTFNTYAHKLTSTPLIFIFEAGLGTIFLLHIVKAITNYTANRRARGKQGYAKTAGAHLTQKKPGAGSRKSLASSTSILSGVVIIAFMILHLKGLKFGHSEHYLVEGGTEIRNLYATQVDYFRSPLIVGFYVLAMGLIGMHLWHGIWSAFQSLGLLNTRMAPGIIRAGQAFTLLLTLGFCFFPIYTFLTYSGNKPAAMPLEAINTPETVRKSPGETDRTDEIRPVAVVEGGR